MRAPGRGHGAVAYVGRGKGRAQPDHKRKVEAQQIKKRYEVERQRGERQHATPNQRA